VAISVNSGKEQLFETAPGRQTFCIDAVSLDRGENRISIVGFRNGQKVAEKAVRVFREQDLFPESSTPPPGFAPFFFHTEKGEKKCQKCHALELSDEISAPERDDKASCSRCHKQIISGTFVHGPAVVWSCRVCHNVRTANDKYGTLQPTEKLCMPCHDSVEQWKKEPYMHGPTAMGACTTCHDPHSDRYEYFLPMNITDLCADCHEDKVTKPHVITTFNGKGHPVWRDPDPFHSGRVFSCASCHNPHASQYSKLLNFDDSSLKTFCTHCHQM
jgi:predicted CXXCH cytochrome family protein